MKGRYRYWNKKNSDDKFRITGQSTVWKPGDIVNQTWKAYQNAWLGYTIEKKKGEDDRKKYYASVIQKLRTTSRYRLGHNKRKIQQKRKQFGE
jgi:hypothetical protein